MTPLRDAQAAWDETEGPVLRVLLRILLTVAMVLAAPFFAAAFLFLLLEKPIAWTLVAGSIGAVFVTLALVAWLVIRAKLRAMRRSLDEAASWEGVVIEHER